MVDSRLILRTLYSSLFLFFVSSLWLSNSWRASASASASSPSMAFIMSKRSFLCLVYELNISTCSASNSDSSADRLFRKLSFRSFIRMYWRSMRESTMEECPRRAIWYCSSASSRSRSSICTIASFRSTSRSWFCERISMSFLCSSTLLCRMILRHWLWIFSMLDLAYRSSFSCFCRSLMRAISTVRQFSSSAARASISRRTSRSSSVSFLGLTCARVEG